MVALMLVLLFAATVSGESSDVTDDYVDSGVSGKLDEGEEAPTPSSASETTTVSEETLDIDDYVDTEGSGKPDEGEGMPTPSSAAETTVVTKELPSCESLAEKGVCKMEHPDRIKNASCPVA